VACPAICRAPAANPVHAVYQVQPSRLILLPLRGRSRARWSATPVAPTASGQNQNQSSKLLLLSLLIFIPRTSRHRKTRLGCRLNAGGAEWAERHGCRESAVRTGMSVRRGPTERRRSEGTSTKSRPNQEQMVLVTFPERKVTRCKSGTIIRAAAHNGYTPHLRSHQNPKHHP
jgi:hypothetical protein